MAGIMDSGTGAGAYRATHHTSTDVLLDGIIRQVFKEDLRRYEGQGQCLDGITSELPDYGSVQCLLSVILEDRVRNQHQNSLVPPWSCDGRLGPTTTQFDPNSVVGNFSFPSGQDKNLLNSQDNFSTVRANACVYKGRWQYELMLGTKGVMQVGWATLGCTFSEEKGVGDTVDSYAYDGNRQRKWNVKTHKYGALWQSSDVISCTLDLDEGKVEFYRNGTSLGPAFTNIRTGPGYAYFPAVSLAIGESLHANFGSTPFRYPQPGFAPLEAPPTQDLIHAQSCVEWLCRLVHLSRGQPTITTMEDPHTKNRFTTCLLLVSQHISKHLGPLLLKPYVVEAILVPALSHLAQVSVDQDNPKLALQPAHTLIDFLIGSLENHELLKCFENLIVCLLTGHKQASQNIKFTGQKYNLRLLYTLLSHVRLRKIYLNNILFDKVKFPSFVNIKAIDEEGLKAVVTYPWWASKDGSVSSGDERLFKDACALIGKAIKELEDLQTGILRLLLCVTDGDSYPHTSRAIFLAKFREFLKEHGPGSRVSVLRYTPLPVILCLFHRLLSIFEELWNEESEGASPVHPHHSNPPVHVPPRIFYEGGLNYFDTHRLGGLESHLFKMLKKDIEQALAPSTSTRASSSGYGEETKVLLKINNATAGSNMDLDEHVPTTSTTPLFANLQNMSVNPGHPSAHPPSPKKLQKHPDSLLQLLDGIILLYHIGAHKQLGKVAAQRESMLENVNHVSDLAKKQEYCQTKSLSPVMVDELAASRKVFETKLEEQARQQAWIMAAVYSTHKQTHLTTLLRIILDSLKAASKEGELFAFVPDFYIDSLTELCAALRLYFPTEESQEDNQALQTLLQGVGEFLALHFCDSRIVYADSKDSLIQALAGFVCHPPTLSALEGMPEESRKQMVRNLLQPYENRAWAQNNFILVRFWKGCGFGFRYTKSPHLVNKFGPKPPNADNSNFTQATAPCPSTIFQNHVVEVLEGTSEVSTAFLNSLLNQLNWAFSEFIGMLQEIQNASNRPERVFIDSRQLRICATCFDLALALLRVLEMIVSKAPHLFADQSRPNAQFLLSRLCQLLCQVLNRVSGCSGCFGHVVSLEIPGLETIHHYPILTAVSGIILALLSDEIGSTKAHLATKTLLNEPSFQLSSIQQLLGDQEDEEEEEGKTTPSSSASPTTTTTTTTTTITATTTTTPGNNSSSSSSSSKFSLKKYQDHISRAELGQVERLIAHLSKCKESMRCKKEEEEEEEDKLCTICYAYPATAVFNPCSHTSCQACVTQHLMNKTECFFCKTTIKEVFDQTTQTTIYTAPNST